MKDDIDSRLADLVKRDPTAKELLEKLGDLCADLAESIPGLGTAIKLAAWTGGWYFDAKKPDRVFPVILGLREEQVKIAREYVNKAEFADLLEETLKRVSEQPDEGRREDLRTIFLKIAREPRTHDENRLFIRWADELPREALRVLAAVHDPVPGPPGRMPQTDTLLAQRAEIIPDQMRFWMEFLASQGLFDRTSFERVSQPAGLEFLLTILGKRFEDYRRG